MKLSSGVRFVSGDIRFSFSLCFFLMAFIFSMILNNDAIVSGLTAAVVALFGGL